MPGAVAGLLLAAGAGRRMGGPKALVRGDDGTPWVVRVSRDLRAAGCDPVRVVVGAAAADVLALLAADSARARAQRRAQRRAQESNSGSSDHPQAAGWSATPQSRSRGWGTRTPVEAVVAADWAEGLGASLRVGLDGLARSAPEAEAVLVHLVDLPDVGSEVLARVASYAEPTVLARAVYAGRPGHPVLLGRDHWPAVAAEARGDSGARAYLADRVVLSVDCTDLASGADVDHR